MILKKKKSYFKEELAKNLKKVKKLWTVLKSIGLSSNKASKSRTSLKKDDTIQFEALGSTNIFKRFYPEKPPKAPYKFTIQATKNYYAKSSCN